MDEPLYTLEDFCVFRKCRQNTSEVCEHCWLSQEGGVQAQGIFNIAESPDFVTTSPGPQASLAPLPRELALIFLLQKKVAK